MTPRPRAADRQGCRRVAHYVAGSVDKFSVRAVTGPGKCRIAGRVRDRSTLAARGVNLPNTREGQSVKIVKDICTVVPVVLVTATAVIGVATVIGLSSWALL